MVIHKLRLEEMKELSVPAEWVTFQGVDPSPNSSKRWADLFRQRRA